MLEPWCWFWAPRLICGTTGRHASLATPGSDPRELGFIRGFVVLVLGSQGGMQMQ